jgi:hypothetical protein
MSYQPTGRPPGRPKTKVEPDVRLLARVPQAMAKQVAAYAAQHGTTVSTLIREGLEWRISEHPVREEFVSDANGVVHEEFLSDRNDTPLDELLADATPAEVEALVSDTNTTALDTIVSDMNPAPYDTTKYYLGKLCKRQHDYQGSGLSLLYIRNHRCIACDRESAQKRRREKRGHRP